MCEESVDVITTVLENHLFVSIESLLKLADKYDGVSKELIEDINNKNFLGAEGIIGEDDGFYIDEEGVLDDYLNNKQGEE